MAYVYGFDVVFDQNYIDYVYYNYGYRCVPHDLAADDTVYVYGPAPRWNTT